MENNPIGYEQVAIAASFLIGNCLISLFLGLSLEASLTVAAIRCTLQLQILSLILKPVLTFTNPILIFAISIIQICISVTEIVMIRTKFRHDYMAFTVLISIATAVISIAFLGDSFSIQSTPWYSPREFIPTFGMVLGNTMTSVAIALNSYMSNIVDNRERIDMYLSFGASRFEAASPVLIEACRLGLLPGINSMAITGLIAIPGMMTGQIIAGANVDDAVRYQQIIMFMISASSCLGVILTVLFATFVVFDSKSRLRIDLVHKAYKWQDVKGYFTKLLWKTNS